jgi:hypothetical protein
LKAKVIVEVKEKGQEFKVRRMTYTDVIVNYPIESRLHNYKYNEVSLVSEGEVDDFLIENKEFLKIKLNRGISIFFYKALKDSLENELNGDLIDFNLLRDKYNVNKRGIWNKEIICMANNKILLMVNATGHNFKREGYNILVSQISEERFLEASEGEIKRINEEIKRRESIISAYLRAINSIKNRIISI